MKGNKGKVSGSVVIWLVLAAASCHHSVAADRAEALAPDADFVAGQIVVWFEDGTSAAVMEEAVAETGGTIIERSTTTPTRVVVAIPEGREEEYVAKYRRLPQVKAADKNYKMKAFGTSGGAR